MNRFRIALTISIAVGGYGSTTRADARDIQAESPGSAMRRVFCATNRLQSGMQAGRPQFGAERGPLRYLSYQLTVGSKHRPGRIDDVVIRSAKPAGQLSGLTSTASRKKVRNVLVFVHGFYVAHEESVRRGAQIANELNHRDVAVVFSWPSLCQFSKRAYLSDRETLEESVKVFATFLRDVATTFPTGRIQVLGHSLGCRLISRAAAAIAGQPKPMVQLAGILFASPDVDAKTFPRKFAPSLLRVAERVTVYYSRCDPLLPFAQKFLAGRPRLGRDGPPANTPPTIEAVDFTALGCSFATHNFYREHATMLKDIRGVLNATIPFSRREMLARATANR